MKVKICGMLHNVEEVSSLNPDFLGFIFYNKSPRNYEKSTITVPDHIKRVGVFVDASFGEIIEKVDIYKLDVIQLHGQENPAFCLQLQNYFLHNPKKISIWKVFGVLDTFDFSILEPFEARVDAFLFDTKGKSKGGTGRLFNWNLLQKYPSDTPFVLSGGIGEDQLENIIEIANTSLPILAIDLNSKFEDSPGMKNTSKLKRFITKVKMIENEL